MYQSRMYFNTEIMPNTEENTDNAISSDNPEIAIQDGETQDYSHYISEKPDSQLGRTMRVYMPAKSAGTQGTAKVGMWKVEPMNPGKRWGNPLMGWTSTRDPLQSINVGLERFETKEHAIQWCISNGIEIYIICIYIAISQNI